MINRLNISYEDFKAGSIEFGCAGDIDDIKEIISIDSKLAPVMAALLIIEEMDLNGNDDFSVNSISEVIDSLGIEIAGGKFKPIVLAQDIECGLFSSSSLA